MLLGSILEEADEWLDERPERRLHDDQRDPGELTFESCPDPFARLAIVRDVDSGDVVRHRQGESDRLDHVSGHVRGGEHYSLVAPPRSGDCILPDPRSPLPTALFG